MTEPPNAGQPAPVAGRRAELAANLADLTARITAACHAANRDPAEVTMIAVTKTFPGSDVALLAELGITEVGENRDQEAAAKHAECLGLGLRWHFVGQLQRNKVRSVVGYADVVHSVDRLALVTALSNAAVAAQRTCTALIQVSLDPPAASGRGGAAIDEVSDLAEALAVAPGLALGGVMAVAPLNEPAEPAFGRLAVLAEGLRGRHPGATMISAGMTADLEAAIHAGATHLRVGTALLGRRSAAFG
jgi:hypothetical protein